MEMQQAGFFAGRFVGVVIVAHWGLEVLFSICGLLAFVAFVLVFLMPGGGMDYRSISSHAPSQRD